MENIENGNETYRNAYIINILCTDYTIFYLVSVLQSPQNISWHCKFLPLPEMAVTIHATPNAFVLNTEV